MTSISQVGTDRIIEIQFSEGRYRLFLEFYAAGNIVLTDNDLNILALFRVVPGGADQEELRVGLTYLLDHRQNFNGVPDMTDERVKESLRKAADKLDVEDDMNNSGKKSKLKKDHTLRSALVTSLKEFSPIIIDHALRASDIDFSARAQDLLIEDAVVARVTLALTETQKMIENMMKSTTLKGFIVLKPRKSTAFHPDREKGFNPNSEINESLLYEEYHPFIPHQYVDNPDVKVIAFDGFNRTVDEFYSSLEAQHVQSRHSERDENAKRKLEAARQDHEKRLDRLQQTQEIHYQKAQALEANLQNVQDTMDAINRLIAQGMGWVEIERLIEMEQGKQNDVAKMIRLPLKLYENTITLLLTLPSFDDEEDFEGNESDCSASDGEVDRAETEGALKAANSSETMLAVDVDLGLSPWSNARLYYEQKKTAAIKEQKTLQSSVKALKSTEKKINADLNKALKQEKVALRPVRKPFWFEKFFYFISSEGYLVLGGRDMLQNDILYTRHLKKGDVYVHADLQGAASIIVKNKTGQLRNLIPPSTLAEAGTLAVITSSAWDSKAVMSAWWVAASQVSKRSVTGNYLPAGEFAILGQKSFLPPAQLLLGFGVMFHISEESKARHFKNRDLTETSSNFDNLIEDCNFEGANPSEQEATDEYDMGAIQPPSAPSQLSLGANYGVSPINSGSTSNFIVKMKGAQLSPLRNKDSFQAEAVLAHARNTDTNTSAEDLVPTLEKVTFSSNGRNEFNDGRDLGINSRQPEMSAELDVRQPFTYRDAAGDECKVDNELQESETDHLPTSETEKAKQANEGYNLASVATFNTSVQAAQAKLESPVRGKRGKAKRAKEKYGDQDEEDRKAALHLLGSVAAQERAQQQALARAAREQEIEAQKERRRQQLLLAAQKVIESEQLRQARLQAEADLSDGEGVEGATDLGAFVGTLLPGDEILDAFIVCGPWSSIGNRCRWKAKLQPGPIKKGKIVREILARWSSEITNQEKRKVRGAATESVPNDESTEVMEVELLKRLNEQEIMGVVPVGKCRIMIGAVKTVDGKIKGQARGKVRHPSSK